MDLTSITWRKSSLSGSNAECVELGHAPERAAVRDSKNPTGPVLVFPTSAIATLLRTS
ncbi:uncharacterized protein DUF397 [Herbihabitans rhizosphaerae]|uniref:Uncharacterized protein DUF397 n=1 Tax=Herbihabitans rhizosphaerae TaxID=1872711 RepID=A0A4Q7KCG4_9PSEU|nr:DUF397 domain-containing protein [Herbihabitans rhizosphaerae]RZS30315.1 uncharacterized protein DUF397 [Herbihabitans rhizosphaerae]